MSFTDTVKKIDWTKVYLIEIEPKRRIDEEVWTQDGARTNCWWIDHSTEGEPSRVKEDGLLYSDAPASLLDLDSCPSGYWWDATNERLYVHTLGSDDPAGATYKIASYFWYYFTNQQFTDEPVIYNGHWYLPYLDAESIPDVTLKASEYYQGGVKKNFGSISMINSDGFFDKLFSKYIWEYAKILIKICEKGASVGDIATFWVGKLGVISSSDEVVGFDVLDYRSV